MPCCSFSRCWFRTRYLPLLILVTRLAKSESVDSCCSYDQLSDICDANVLECPKPNQIVADVIFHRINGNEQRFGPVTGSVVDWAMDEPTQLGS
jgi:hypothetical protein